MMKSQNEMVIHTNIPSMAWKEEKLNENEIQCREDNWDLEMSFLNDLNNFGKIILFGPLLLLLALSVQL